MGNKQPNNDNTNGFVKYNPKDQAFFGAKTVVDTEHEHIFKRRGVESDKAKQKECIDNLSGLSLSGGGIRSASFSLGVLQALSYSKLLKKIDYLSTVSGGGYIGSSLTWLLSQPWKDNEGNDVDLGVDKENFPYGTYPMIGQAPISGEKPADFNKGKIAPNYRGSLLRYLRQHGKYLTPGNGITGFSLAGVVLRGSILSIFVYFALLILAMAGLKAAHAFDSVNYENLTAPLDLVNSIPNYSILIGVTGIAIFALFALLYSLQAYLLSTRLSSKFIPDKVRSFLENLSYTLRRASEKGYNLLLMAIVVFLVIGFIPEAYKYLSPPGTDKGFFAGIIGAISTGVGFISSISAYIKTSSNKKGLIPISLLVAVGTIALWFGLLLLAFHCSETFCNDETVLGWLAVAVVVIGWFANLNYISVHRYYRDRLMETYMPDVPKVLNFKKSPQNATVKADKARLSSMCGYGSNKIIDMPYHIINTNLVLVSSKIAKFRGRGGDNFILSPAYCGSNATGWQKTKEFMGDRMTLPTAMAISGAAVNPSTGVGGEGITRQRFLSMLMGFLNIRLGYWASNPDPDLQNILTKIPNFFIPGLYEMVFRKSLREDRHYLQLSDGGHFENLAIYELIRRKANLIIVCDGAADPNYEFTDLSNALEKIRTDFGVLIDISTDQLNALIPKKKKKTDPVAFADQGFVIADILYPDREAGTLIYIKSTFFKELSADLYGYKQTHSEFPDEPTSDQFFDEKQFEAYRELGYQTAWHMINHPEVQNNSKVGSIFKACTSAATP